MNKFFKILPILVVLTALLIPSAAGAVMQIRIDLSDKADIAKIAGLNLDIIYRDRNLYYIDIAGSQKDLTTLENNGLRYSIIHEDMTAFYQSRNSDILEMGGYPTMDEAYDSLDLYQSLYPHILTERDSVAYSHEGRPIYMVKLSDNPFVDEPEPEIFINGTIHAREPGSLLFNLYFIRYLCDNYGSDPLVTELVDNREFYFIPLINPDGYEYNRQTNPNGGGMWRKNRNGEGIDLNRNWGYMWGYDDEGSSPYPDDPTYRGPAAFSEVETEGMRQFCNSREFVTALNYHSYGEYCLYAYAYDDTARAEDLELFVAMGDTMTSVNDYAYGTAWQLLYPVNGDAVDWQYGDRDEKDKILSFVIEVGGSGDGFWPSQYRIPQINEENLDLALILSDLSDNPYKIFPPVPPTIYPIGTVPTSGFDIYWNHYDTLNPAIAYEIVEKSGYVRTTEGFEEGTDNWEIDGWVLRDYRPFNGEYSIYSGYQNRAFFTATLINPIAVNPGDDLTFFTWYHIEEDWDYAYIQVSTNNGLTYENLEGNITTNSNPNGNNRGNGITGSHRYWDEAIFPLDDYEGQEIKLRLLYITDANTLREGMYIDDLFPIDDFQVSVILDSNISDTTYHIDSRDSGLYYYQVKGKDADDQWGSYSSLEIANVGGVTGIDDKRNDNVPYAFSLQNNYPNPFNAGTNIGFMLPEPGNIKLEVYNLLGERVAVLADGQYPRGQHTINWDGTDSNGNELASGFYFYRLFSGEKSATKRMLMIK
ncbi:MAG: T9SS type A sorting domain-containing protein [candidate division Zixibacteria bacterium]|nr:T9SS type A sorting domain-containing protein [candidate division Zixibacteria bacterium]